MGRSFTGMIGQVSLRRVLRLSVGILSSALVAAQPVLAQVASAPGGPEISSAPNGIEMVLIQTPNGQGVSHNQYDVFNVGPDGLILNNIAQPFGQTHLAGIVEGNANLAGGAAQIILNEVVGANPSSLTGYLEVGGTRADVIVANPYGMTCDGCGFLNTDRLTLSTGAPQFDAGTFTGLSVDDGAIAIGTNGLDALDTTRFDLIARRITVAGSVHGQRINVIAGRNDVIYATGEITERPDDGSPAPDLAIDSTVLGGMYAGALSITSTEDGVGVRAPQQMAATTGEMVLTADGRLVIGQASAAGAVAVESTQGSVEVEEVLVSGGDLSLTSAEDLIAAADARIVSGAAALFDVGRDLQAGAASEIAAGSSVAMSVAQDAVFGDGARVLSYGDVSINAERITGGAETVFLAGAAGGEGDTSQTTLSLGASETIMLAGLAGSAGDISVVAQVLDIAADGALPAGRFVAGGTAQFQLTRLEALEGSLEAGARLELENAGGILEIEGGILQAGEDVTLAGEGIVVSGIVQSLGGAVVAAATAGNLIATGTLAGESVDLHAAGLLETTGTVQGMGSVALSGIELVNSGVISGWDVSLTGDVITNDGTAYGMAALSLFSGGDVTNMGAFSVRRLAGDCGWGRRAQPGAEQCGRRRNPRGRRCGFGAGGSG